MILENFKAIKIKPEGILRIFLAFVFLSAGVFRIFNPQTAVVEFTGLHLPLWLAWPMVVFEIIAGLSLLINKYTRYIYWLLIIFLIFILCWAFIINGRELISGAGELFIFQLNPTDVFLHFVFLMIAIVLVVKNN